MEFSSEQIKLCDRIVRDLNVAIRNSVLYAADHPISAVSLQNFLKALEKWFEDNDSLELGISQDNVFFSGDAVREDDERYAEVAGYLHMRGIISLYFLKGLTAEELRGFFGFIRLDRRTIKEKGGVLENIPPTPHLKIGEVDYSELLVSAREEVSSEEDKIWKFLFETSRESAGGELPASKVEFMLEVLNDAGKSAHVLNKVYRDAVDNLRDEEAAGDIKESISKICSYFEKYSPQQAREVKSQLMQIISKLHPDLITILFEQTVGADGRNIGLADEITKGFSDTYIAEFIESLITSEDTFNENLLKLFDKLVPGETRANSVVSMVADRLFSKRVLNPETLSKLQMSIKEIFKKRPESNFMAQMYNITVDAVINRKIDTLVYVAKLSPMINKFVQSIKEENLRREEIWLLLNILWLEDSPDEFRKFGEKIIEVLPEILNAKDTGRLREILEFFSDNMRPEQRENEALSSEASGLMEKIAGRQTKDSLISFIPDSSPSELEDISQILVRTPKDSVKMLLDAFVMEKNPAHRNKFLNVLSRMKKDVTDEIIDRLDYSEPWVIRDLFGILREYAPDRAHLVSKKLIAHKDPQVRWQGLDGYEPRTAGEKRAILEMLKKEKDMEVRKKAATVILRTRDEEVISEMFTFARRELFRKEFLFRLVELSGQVRSTEALPHLRDIFLRRPWFCTRKRDELRIAAATSLARIHTDEAIELVKQGLRDRRKRVRNMCEIILRLDETGQRIEHGEE